MLNRAKIRHRDRLTLGQVLTLPGSTPIRPRPQLYKVKKGDTLSGIAEVKLGDADRWPEIARLNRDVVRDPDDITPAWSWSSSRLSRLSLGAGRLPACGSPWSRTPTVAGCSRPSPRTARPRSRWSGSRDLPRGRRRGGAGRAAALGVGGHRGAVPGAAGGRGAGRPLRRPPPDRGDPARRRRPLGRAALVPGGLGPPGGPAGARRHRGRGPGGQPALFDHGPARPARRGRAAGGVVAVHADQQRRLAGLGRPGGSGAGQPGQGSGCWPPPSRPGRWPRPRWPRPGCHGGRRCTTPSSPSCSAPGRGPGPPRSGCATWPPGSAPPSASAPQPRLARPGPAGLRRRRDAAALDPLPCPARPSTTRPCRCCWPTRSCRGCTPPTAGPGWTPGWPAGGSGPSTCPAGWCRAAGRPAGAAPSRSPIALRRAVVADPGWTLVVADASQLEPRVLAALSGDDGLARAGRRRRPVRRPGRRRLRRRPGAGQDRPAGRHVRRRRGAADDGAAAAVPGRGRLRGGGGPDRRGGRPGPLAPGQDLPATVRGLAGRHRPGRGPTRTPTRRRRGPAGPPATGAASPATSWSRPAPPTGPWSCWPAPAAGSPPGPRHRPAPSWCSSSTTRWWSTAPGPTPSEVAAAVRDAADESRRLVFGDTAVRFPLAVAVVDCYADAK